jgi:uncharacterized protein (DUF952 family)
MEIFHLATASDWAEARRTGGYTTSTRGRTLEQEGFLHAARADQWQAVRARYYADVREPLLLLVIDTDRLTVPWREDPVGEETYPHIYGPLDPVAVVRTVPLAPSTATFASLFFGEVFSRILLALVFMVITIAGALVAGLLLGSRLAIVGAVVGAAVGVLVDWAIVRRRTFGS